MKSVEVKFYGLSSKKTERLWFDELSMKEAERGAKAGKVVIIPVGSVEEHGDHLPLCTDSLQPEYVALARARLNGAEMPSCLVGLAAGWVGIIDF